MDPTTFFFQVLIKTSSWVSIDTAGKSALKLGNLPQNGVEGEVGEGGGGGGGEADWLPIVQKSVKFADFEELYLR